MLRKLNEVYILFAIDAPGWRGVPKWNSRHSIFPTARAGFPLGVWTFNEGDCRGNNANGP